LGDLSSVVWQTSDGLTWREVADMGTGGFFYATVANADGTRLGRIFPDRGDQQLMVASDDGHTWHEITNPRTEPVRAILPGSPDGQDPWVVIYMSLPDNTEITTATSFDLAVWEERSSPMRQIEAVVRTRYGLIAISTIPCVDEGGEGAPVVEVEASECPAPEYTTYLSHDGLSWVKLGSHVPAMGIADGPAGVIGIAGWEARGPEGLTVWRLGPD
jgi:hypothetical protein